MTSRFSTAVSAGCGVGTEELASLLPARRGLQCATPGEAWLGSPTYLGGGVTPTTADLLSYDRQFTQLKYTLQ